MAATVDQVLSAMTHLGDKLDSVIPRVDAIEANLDAYKEQCRCDDIEQAKRLVTGTPVATVRPDEDDDPVDQEQEFLAHFAEALFDLNETVDGLAKRLDKIDCAPPKPKGGSVASDDIDTPYKSAPPVAAIASGM